MSLDVRFPQGSGLGACLKITNGFDLLKDNKTEDMATRVVKDLARFVATYVTLVYFAKGGICYNTVSCLGNAALGFVSLADNRDKAIEHFKDCGRNAAFGAIDLLTLYVSSVIALANALFPDATVRTYEQFSNLISEVKATT
jgi:hypothetical protein